MIKGAQVSKFMEETHARGTSETTTCGDKNILSMKNEQQIRERLWEYDIGFNLMTSKMVCGKRLENIIDNNSPIFSGHEL